MFSQLSTTKISINSLAAWSNLSQTPRIGDLERLLLDQDRSLITVCSHKNSDHDVDDESEPIATSDQVYDLLDCHGSSLSQTIWVQLAPVAANPIAYCDRRTKDYV